MEKGREGTEEENEDKERERKEDKEDRADKERKRGKIKSNKKAVKDCAGREKTDSSASINELTTKEQKISLMTIELDSNNKTTHRDI